MRKNDQPREEVLAAHIRTQVPACHLTFSGDLKGGPVLYVQQSALSEPVRDVLLPDRPIRELSQPRGELPLAAQDAHGASQGDNVLLFPAIHRGPEYTNEFVPVNAPICVTGANVVCIVRHMSAAKKKLVVGQSVVDSAQPSGATGKDGKSARRSSKRMATPGPDGKTLNQRLAEAMAYQTGICMAAGRAAFGEKELRAEVNRLAGAEDESYLSQQTLNAIVRGKVSESKFTALIAHACGVSAAWLAQGVGPMIVTNPKK